ncbi:MAG: polyprenyl synthetase family protein [Gemmatimonadota bacterium]|nr:polyprenyl synthetase family protein [Gemmatimonadota bacterium]
MIRLAADDVPASLVEAQRAIEEALHLLCDRGLDGVPAPIADAIRYSMLGGGKRLRPQLVLAVHQAAGGTGDASLLAASVEIVHAYSLVHDDLPCMDDDSVRRGRPTLHKVYGVTVATIAGVTMVPFAARTALEGARAIGLPLEVCGSIVRQLMQASGAGGMVGGQLLDLEGEGKPLTLADLERIHRAKTGALIAASVRIGAIAAGASGERATALDRYGESVGLAFQIADDVLDATATSEQLGKTAGRDAALGKVTYPAVLGVDGAIARATELADEACRALDAVGLLTPELDHLARFSVSRRS